MIRYRLDSWRCLGRNANGGLLIHAVDKSPEIGAAVIDDDVEGSARPWLILDAVDEALMQHAVAFNPIRIVVGAGQDLQQVHTADDTDHQLVLNDRHPLDAVLLHQVRDFPQRCFRLRRYHLTRHHIAYPFGVRLDELPRQRVAWHGCFDLPGTEPFGADLDAPDQIALRNDADQLRVDIDDGERPDAVSDHRNGRDLNGNIGANRDNPTNHHVPRLHVRLPCSGRSQPDEGRERNV